MAEIKIYGTLVNATTDPKIAKASQIFDEELNKYQSEINTQLGISDDSLHKELTNFKNTKGKANGLASLDNSGKVPSTQLPSYVDDVLEFTQLDQLPKPGESGKIYVVTSTNLQYRWSGSDYVEISKSLALGETSSTAYPGDKGKATTDVVNSLSDNLVNDVLVSQSDKNSVSLTIKSITKNPVKKNKELLLVDGEPILLTDNTPILLGDNVNDGLYDQADDKLITINQASSFTAGVMSASDKTKLDGLKAQAEIDTSISNVQNNLNAHINNRTNPHRVTKEQIGLDQVDNTSDANKPISNATQELVDNTKKELEEKINNSGNDLQDNIDKIDERVTNIENSVGAPDGIATLDSEGKLEVSQIPNEALNVIEGKYMTETQFTDSEGVEFIPRHNTIYIDSIGGSNKLYRWDGFKYVEVSDSDNVTEAIDNHIKDFNNPHKVTAEQIGLGNVDNTADIDKPISTAVQEALDTVNTKVTEHTENKENPHGVTAEQIGLGNVDNTSDADKPISSATQTALNGKFSATDGNALKQRVDNIPELVATDITVDSDNDSVNISLDKTSIVDGTLSGTTININSATASKAGILVPTDKSKIDKIITNGNGTKYLSDNGTYKEVQGGSADIESLKQYVNDSISSARSVGYMMQLTEIDASGLDENTWYPVTIAAGERMNIRVEVLVALDSGTKPSWSTHGRGFSVRKIWEFAPYTWGVNPRSILAVHLSDFKFADTDPVRGLSTLSNFDTCYVYVRGGGKYHFYASHGAIVILHTDTYAPGSDSQSISPTTEIPDLIQEIDYSNWHSIKNVLNNGNEFNFADGEVGERVWLNYRSRSGNTVSAGKLYIGNGQATGGFAEVHASGFFKESDIRLKSNIVPLNHTLDQICNIPTVEFDMHDKHQIGTVAQDLENNFAEIVNTDSDGMKSVDYCMLGVVAVEGIKLLKQEIEDLKKQVEELKNGNAILGRNL